MFVCLFVVAAAVVAALFGHCVYVLFGHLYSNADADAKPGQAWPMQAGSGWAISYRLHVVANKFVQISAKHVDNRRGKASSCLSLSLFICLSASLCSACCGVIKIVLISGNLHGKSVCHKTNKY